MKKRVKKFSEGGTFGRYKGQPDEPIEPVYPLEEAALAGPAGRLVGRAAKELELLTRPKVKNSIYEYMPGKGTNKKYVQRYVHDPAEIENIRESGYMLAKPGGKPKKYFTAVDEVKPAGQGSDTLRILRDKVPAERAVRRKDIERYNAETEAWEPLKKGGKVKKYAEGGTVRGHGCEKRGKTRGKFK